MITPRTSEIPEVDALPASKMLTPSEIESLRKDSRDALARGREILRSMKSNSGPIPAKR